jgi:hypothetical protein
VKSVAKDFAPVIFLSETGESLFHLPSHRANKGVPQPEITIGKEQESIHEKKNQLKFHLSPFFTRKVIKENQAIPLSQTNLCGPST